MVELLAPAGSFEGFLGAINAGADAVYLGGEKYNARAYADNFTESRIAEALDMAHFYGKKVYLTMNTLLKDDEIEQAALFVESVLSHHPDGIIVQDFGLAALLGRLFPTLELHASTQMTVTGPAGAEFLKEKGFTRIVPARELSLEEIKEIKKCVDMEVECFIHGAMCYCYSGQCLFSSILGGRSGNRGRCAQPCRLPFSVHLQETGDVCHEKYPLSMKDLCTIYMLPDLIDAGIDSFKIEGRMKQPAYACGVTAMYRKYIDLYNQYGREAFSVRQEDTDRLSMLYIRSDIHDGYYGKHNGKDMITPGKPSYTGSDERLTRELAEKYIKMPQKHPVSMQIYLETHKPAKLSISDDESICAEVFGDVPEAASGRPLTEDQIEKQLKKTGNSLVACENVTVHMKEALFMPVSALNRLRRDAVLAYEDERRRLYGYEACALSAQRMDDAMLQPTGETAEMLSLSSGRQLHVSVMLPEQLEALADIQPDRIYVDADLWLKDPEAVGECVRKYMPETDIYLMLPYIVRKRDRSYYDRLYRLLVQDTLIDGFLLRNLEQIPLVGGWKQKMPERSIRCVGDTNLYQMNRFSADFTDAVLDEYTLPYELNYRELKNLCAKAHKNGRSMTQIIYGRIPMMISANCIKKTEDGCDHIQELSAAQYLEDRYKKKFPVYNNCDHCYNVIYNSVPYSLHNKIDQMSQLDLSAFRIDLVLEKKSEVQRILGSFRGVFSGDKNAAHVPKEFTTGHFARGVE